MHSQLNSPKSRNGAATVAGITAYLMEKAGEAEFLARLLSVDMSQCSDLV